MVNVIVVVHSAEYFNSSNMKLQPQAKNNYSLLFTLAFLQFRFDIYIYTHYIHYIYKINNLKFYISLDNSHIQNYLGKQFVFTTVIPILSLSICIMCTGDTRCYQSFSKPNLIEEKKQGTKIQKENIKNKHQTSWWSKLQHAQLSMKVQFR